MMTAGRLELLEECGTRVVDLQVGDEHAIHPALLGQPAVGRVVVLLGHLQQQRVPARATGPPRGRR